MINITKLSQELIKAGISTQGNCNSKGVVWDDDNKEIQDRADVEAVLLAHDSKPSGDSALREEYNHAGILTEDMLFALWKKVMQSNSVDADAIQIEIDKLNLSVN